jgi:hypothetical protein
MARQVKSGTAWGWWVLALSPFLLVFLVVQAGDSSVLAFVYFYSIVGFDVWVVARMVTNRRADNTRGTNPQSTTARGVPIPKRSRTIPQDVKIAVSVRDGGKCRICGSTKDLQYDHIIPWSRGGSSTDPDNIQLLCGYHNRLKRDL